jgi:hypothetical protein
MPELFPDGKTVHTEIDADGTVRVSLDLGFYDDHGSMRNRNDRIVLSVRPGGLLDLHDPVGGSGNDPLLRFARRSLQISRGVYSPIDEALHLVRGEVPTYRHLEVQEAWEKEVLSLIEAGIAPREAQKQSERLRPIELGRRHKASAMAIVLWNAMWKRALPFLDQQALRLARKAVPRASVYNALVQSSRLRELAEIYPGVVEVLEATSAGDGGDPEGAAGWLTRDGLAARVAIGDLLRLKRLLHRDIELSPGFMAWMRHGRFSIGYTGMLDRFRRQSRIRFMAELVNDLDPNRVRALKGAEQWRLFNIMGFESADLIPAFLRNPDGAVRSMRDFMADRATRDPDARKRDLALGALREIADTMRASEVGSYARPVSVDHSFARIVRETRRYHREIYARGEAARDARLELAACAMDKRKARLQELEAATGAVVAPPARNAVFPRPVFAEKVGRAYRMEWVPDGWALAAEAAIMAHCVDSYTGSCAEGRSVIFHVSARKNGEALATVELGRNGRILQISGPFNRPVSRELTKWVREKVSESAPDGMFGDLRRDVAVGPPEHRDTTDARQRPKMAKYTSRPPAVTRLETAEHVLSWIETGEEVADFAHYLMGRWQAKNAVVAYRVIRKRDGMPSLLVGYAYDRHAFRQVHGLGDETLGEALVRALDAASEGPLLPEHLRFKLRLTTQAITAGEHRGRATLASYPVEEDFLQLLGTPFDAGEDLPF